MAGLARAYFNLGVLQAQVARRAEGIERFARAAEFFERTAAIDPDFPQVQSRWGWPASTRGSSTRPRRR